MTMPVSQVLQGELAISCHGVTKLFGLLTAVDNLTMEVPKGTLLGLLGPNGAGKTTLIRILLGLTRMSKGKAEVLGEPVPSKDILPHVGYMPQNLATYLDLTVEQNLSLFGKLQGMSGESLASRIDESLKRVALTERKKELVSHLSGGMQRRVSLAAAILPDPELLLLDEPTVGVDPELRAEFWEYFHQITGRGRTVLMTTHYMEEASQCDKVAMMHEGRMLAFDAPSVIKERTKAETMDAAFLRLVREKRKEQGVE
jgi:ABC-2 type transport system ATP-binding protein